MQHRSRLGSSPSRMAAVIPPHAPPKAKFNKHQAREKKPPPVLEPHRAQHAPMHISTAAKNRNGPIIFVMGPSTNFPAIMAIVDRYGSLSNPLPAAPLRSRLSRVTGKVVLAAIIAEYVLASKTQLRNTG